MPALLDLARECPKLPAPPPGQTPAMTRRWRMIVRDVAENPFLSLTAIGRRHGVGPSVVLRALADHALRELRGGAA